MQTVNYTNGKSESRRWKKTPETQERAQRTRKKLLEAARITFSRDGFELTRLDDIAKLAGKSRGAFYAHFENKEDIFFAVFEDDIICGRCSPPGKDCMVVCSNGDVIIRPQHFARILRSKQQWLLYLELNLYARRASQPSSRFRRLLQKIRTFSPGAEFAVIFSAFDPDKFQQNRRLRETSH